MMVTYSLTYWWAAWHAHTTRGAKVFNGYIIKGGKFYLKNFLEKWPIFANVELGNIGANYLENSVHKCH